MKFNVNSYHLKLLKDYERLSVFKEAIDDYAGSRIDDLDSSNLQKARVGEMNSNGLAFDLGCGSGVLSYFAKDYFEKIIAIELNGSSYSLARENLGDFENIQVFNEDVLSFDFDELGEKADLIICEMLDTALIDEEEVPVLNHSKNYLKEDGVIIPQAIINSVEPIFMNNNFIQYEDDEYSPIYVGLGKSIVYSEFNFLDEIDCNFSTVIELKTYDHEALEEINFTSEISREIYEKFNLKENFNIEENKLKINGIKLTSFTKLSENIICGPTPMLNPSLLVPIDEVEVNCGDVLRIRLEYIMGGGVESIRTEVLDIFNMG